MVIKYVLKKKKYLECLKNCQKFSGSWVLKDTEWVALGVIGRVGSGQWYVAPDLKPCYKLYNFLPYMIFSQNFKSMKDSLFTNCLIQYNVHKVCVWTISVNMVADGERTTEKWVKSVKSEPQFHNGWGHCNLQKHREKPRGKGILCLLVFLSLIPTEIFRNMYMKTPVRMFLIFIYLIWI